MPDYVDDVANDNMYSNIFYIVYLLHITGKFDIFCRFCRGDKNIGKWHCYTLQKKSVCLGAILVFRSMI